MARRLSAGIWEQCHCVRASGTHRANSAKNIRITSALLHIKIMNLYAVDDIYCINDILTGSYNRRGLENFLSPQGQSCLRRSAIWFINFIIGAKLPCPILRQPMARLVSIHTVSYISAASPRTIQAPSAPPPALPARFHLRQKTRAVRA